MIYIQAVIKENHFIGFIKDKSYIGLMFKIGDYNIKNKTDTYGKIISYKRKGEKFKSGI